MSTSPHMIALPNGEHLKISILHPPLPEARSDLVWWQVVKEELVSGAVSPWLYSAYFVGEVEGEFAASMACYVPDDTRDIGVVEFVQTVEHHRRKGIASKMLQHMIETFRADGGKVLYLCTANPDAGTLYEKHGFRYHTGDGMRYLAPGYDSFDEVYFGYDGAGQIRDAHWGDLPRVTALYNHDSPKWLIKDYISRSFSETRYEQHFMQLMKNIEGDIGAFMVIESPHQHVVGAAALARYDTYYEQHVAELTIRIIPAYLDTANELFKEIETRARQLSIGILQIHLADCDEDQKRLLQVSGFTEEGRLKHHLHNNQGTTDMLIYRKHLTDHVSPVRNMEAYYGGRFLWQEERIRRESKI